MKDSARYVKIVEWSDEDRCYGGSSPGLIYGGCHGDDEKAVFAALCQIVEDAIDVYRREGGPCRPRLRSEISRTVCRMSHSIALHRLGGRSAHPAR